MKKLRLTAPVKHWPRSCSPQSRVADAGTLVVLVRPESATLFTVRREDATDPADTLLVSASEVEDA